MLLLLLLTITELQSQESYIGLEVSGDHYFTESFNLTTKENKVYVSIIPDFRLGLYFGYQLSKNHELQLLSSYGKVSSNYTIFSNSGEAVGKLKYYSSIYQFNLAYLYCLSLKGLKLYPKIILSYNKNVFGSDHIKINKIQNKYSDIQPVISHLALGFFEDYLSGGLGIQFRYFISQNIALNISTAYIFSLAPNILFISKDTVLNDNLSENLNTLLILNSGSRMNTALSFQYNLNYK